MIPEAETHSQVTSTVTINCLVVFVLQAAAPPPTCRGQHVQSLQAVFARWRVVSGLGEGYQRRYQGAGLYPSSGTSPQSLASDWPAGRAPPPGVCGEKREGEK